MKIRQKIMNEKTSTEMLTSVIFHNGKKCFRFFFFLNSPLVTSENLFGGWGLCTQYAFCS